MWQLLENVSVGKEAEGEGKEGGVVGKRLKFLGIQVDCPKAGVVTISRPNFVIGPRSKWPSMIYTAKCPCGEVHKIPTKSSDHVAEKILTEAKQGRE